MAAWRGIWKSPQTADQRTSIFKATWAATSAFCSIQDSPVWNFIPQAEFLPQDLAWRPSTRMNTRQIPIIQHTPPPSHRSASAADSISGANQYQTSEGTSDATINSRAQASNDTQDQQDNNTSNYTFAEGTTSSVGTQEEAHELNTTTNAKRRRDAEQQASTILRQILLEIDEDDARALEDNTNPQAQTELNLNEAHNRDDTADPFMQTIDLAIQDTFDLICRDLIDY